MLRRKAPQPYKHDILSICFKLSVGGRDGLTVLQDDGSTRSILFATEYHEAYDAKKKKLGP